MSLPSYTVWFRGKPACPCLAEWLPVFEAELRRRGVIRESIDIAQLIGGAAASAGTHSSGGAFDIWQHDPVTQAVGREMGAATWNRTTGSFANNRHTHGVLNGCPHNGPARYQIAALADGYSGLGSGGRGSRDTGPGPRHLRTWREGIEWAKRQQQEDFMATDEAKKLLEKIVRQNEAAKRRDVHLREKIIKPLVESLPELLENASAKRRVTKSKNEILAAIAELRAMDDEAES